MSAAWILPVAVALISAVPAFTAAIIATRSAARSRLTEVQRAELTSLREKSAAEQGKIYQQILELLRSLLNPRDFAPPPDANRVMAEYLPWIAIYGSDEVVLAYHAVMETLTFPTPPPAVPIRLVAELFVAVRRDMGYPDTVVQARHVLGLGGTSFHPYIDQVWPFATLSVDEMYAQAKWTPPSQRGSDYEVDLPGLTRFVNAVAQAVDALGLESETRTRVESCVERFGKLMVAQDPDEVALRATGRRLHKVLSDAAGDEQTGNQLALGLLTVWQPGTDHNVDMPALLTFVRAVLQAAEALGLDAEEQEKAQSLVTEILIESVDRSYTDHAMLRAHGRALRGILTAVVDRGGAHAALAAGLLEIWRPPERVGPSGANAYQGSVSR